MRRDNREHDCQLLRTLITNRHGALTSCLAGSISQKNQDGLALQFRIQDHCNVNPIRASHPLYLVIITT